MGHFGGHNSGDEAMLFGLIASSPPELRRRFLIVTKTGVLSSVFAEYGAQAIPAHFRPLWQAVNQCEGIILGGGTHFHDDYLRLRYVRHVRYLLRFLLIFSWAKVRGKKVLWLGMGFGPIWRPLTKWLLGWGVHVCDHITVRDSVSAAEIKTYLSQQKFTHAFDLAALAQPETPVHLQADLQRAPQRDKCILGISVVEAESSQTGQASLLNDFWSKFKTALDNVYRQNPRLQIRVFVIRGGEREDDLKASQTLVDFVSQSDSGRVRLVPYHEDPTITLARIAECDYFVGTRFHAGVLSYLGGCRLLLLAYHRKLQDLAQEIELAQDACIDISQPTTVAALETALQGLIGQSSHNVPNLPVATAIERARLSIKVLNRFVQP